MSYNKKLEIGNETKVSQVKKNSGNNDQQLFETLSNILTPLREVEILSFIMYFTVNQQNLT